MNLKFLNIFSDCYKYFFKRKELFMQNSKTNKNSKNTTRSNSKSPPSASKNSVKNSSAGFNPDNRERRDGPGGN